MIVFSKHKLHSEMTVSIRPIEASDKNSWMPLWQGYIQAYEHVNIRDIVVDTTFDRFLDPKSPVWCFVAEDDETHKLIGFVSYVYHAATWCINDVINLHDLFVDPNTRNNGVGRKLIERLYVEAEKSAAPKVYWYTQRFNHRAQLLYSKVAKDDNRIVYSKVFFKN